MSNRTLRLNDDLYHYLCSVSLRENKWLYQLREETAQLPEHNMQIAPDQGQFMALLVRLIGAKKIIEVGTFTGYSALSMALSLPGDGRIECCDISEQWTDIAQRYWRSANVADRISLHIAPALETLQGWITDGQGGAFDLAFIDADKTNYIHYYEKCLTLVRAGGVIVVDNTLWSGAVIDDKDQSDDTSAIRRFNEALHQDERVDISLLPVGDGITLAMKR